MQNRQLMRIDVRARPGEATQGWLAAGPFHGRCALGRAGICAHKREGDGTTPRGRFRLIRVWWRADRGTRPITLLPVRRITFLDGWCEDPESRHYNHPIRLNAQAKSDRLWRTDNLYDLIIEIDHNTRPRIKGHGSAVFIHVARPGLRPTAGCVALPAPALRRLLSRVGLKTRIYIH